MTFAQNHWPFKRTGQKTYKKYVFHQNSFYNVRFYAHGPRKRNFIKKIERLELLVLYGLRFYNLQKTMLLSLDEILKSVN